jgi:cell division protease FtsH
MNQNQNQNRDNPQGTPPRPKFSWIWWVILLALLVWNLLVFLPQGTPEVTLPYSSFIDQVEKGNVASVTITGSTITGTFNTAIPAPATTPAPGTTPTAPAAGTTPTTYTEFTTTFPSVTGDANLIPLLQANGVQINVTPPTSPIISLLLTTILPIGLLAIVMIVILRSVSRGQSGSGIFNFGKTKARLNAPDHPQVTFDDVAGVDEAKQDLQEVVDFLRRPQKYHRLGARIPRGVLLVGPPGTGKTLLARAVAGEAGVPFFIISASEFVEMFVGVGASRVRDLFEQAKASSPAIVFIDELDAVGRRRGTGLGNVNDEREQTLNQLLVEMDGFDERHETIVIAATNRPDVLDPALLRPGRFDRQVTVGLPDKRGREGILKIHTRSLRLSADVDLSVIAQSTTGFSGADLANLCNEAALLAARNNQEQISKRNFDEAVDRIVLGAARALMLNERERRIIAYHESGHAIVAWYSPAADPVYKVTIIPRGRALGVTEQLPGEDQYNYSKEYLLSRLAVMLGGRVAEEVAIGEITTGAESDLVEASRLARRMITRWGMGTLGPMAISTDEEQPFLGYEITQGREFSEETAAKVDRDVQGLLKERYQVVQGMLGKEYRDKLDQLASALLKEETVDQDNLTKILGERTVTVGAQRLPPMAEVPLSADINTKETEN